MIRIILGVVAPAETLLYVNGLCAADVCATGSFPSIVVFGLVLGNFFLRLGVLLDEAICS
jgi:hypothetical protein